MFTSKSFVFFVVLATFSNCQHCGGRICKEDALWIPSFGSDYSTSWTWDAFICAICMKLDWPFENHRS